MYTQVSVTASLTPEPYPLADPAKFYNGGMAMLSDDKILSCVGKENATNILQLPLASIASPIILSITGILGQITALFYLYRTKKPSLNRTVFYVLLATLIWTDLFGKLVTTPSAIIAYASGGWVGGERFCHIHGFFMMTVGLVTHFLVAAMALDRFLCVRHGLFYMASVTKSRIRLSLMGIWLFCIVFCMMPLFGFGEYELQYPGTWCYVNIHVGVETPWYNRLYTNVFGFINIVNVIIILTCNVIVIGTLITARIFRSRKLSASRRQPHRLLPITSQRELELQMSILLLVITIVFVISWFPIDFLIFLNQIWPHKCREEHIRDVMAIRFASINQIIDPWAYVICRKVFTSKIWRDCRSVVLGRNFSSKRANTTLNNNGIHDLENGASCRSKTNESLSSTKRKFSLPTPEKSRANLTNLGIANPLEAGYQPVTYIPVSRQQFRITSDIIEGSCKSNHQNTSKNVHLANYPILTGRRHSWSNAAPSYYRLYRTRSTQTLENI